MDLGPISGQYHMGKEKISDQFKKILTDINIEYLSEFYQTFIVVLSQISIWEIIQGNCKVFLADIE